MQETAVQWSSRMSVPPRTMAASRRGTVVGGRALLSWWWVAAVAVSAAAGGARGTAGMVSGLGNSISVASCRALCLHVFSTPGDDRDARCRKNSDCFMCWNSCGILRHHLTVWTTMCADHTACFPGCQVACGFYVDRVSSNGDGDGYVNLPPPRPPSGLPPPRLDAHGRVTWAAPEWSRSDNPPDDVIYVLLIHGDGGWREFAQTSGTSAPVPAGLRGEVRARLLAVTQQGLQGVSEGHLALDHAPTPPGPLQSPPTLHDRLTPPPPAPPPTPPSDRRLLLAADSSEIPYGYKLDAVLRTGTSQRVGSSTPGPPTLTPVLPADSLAYEVGTVAPAPHDTSVDPSWTVDVREVEVGSLAELTVVWPPRGSGPVEYVLSWAEQSGFVSGHLVTDKVTSKLSLWPGQGYFLQVELVDSQGNAVLKSLATPVIFKSSTENSSDPSSPSSPPTPTDDSFPAESRGSSSTSTPGIGWTAEERVREATQPEKEETDVFSSLHDDPEIHELPGEPSQDSSSESHVEFRTVNREDSDLSVEFPRTSSEEDTESNETVYRKSVPFIVSTTNNLSSGGTSNKTNHVLVWCVGVGIGLLLLLTLCSMVIWLLGRCRKTTAQENPPEEYADDGLNGFRGSFRTYVTQQHVRNQTTSWTFENFCSVGKRTKMEPQKRRAETIAEKAAVPAGIDNASLVENYVFMLDTPTVRSAMQY